MENLNENELYRLVMCLRNTPGWIQFVETAYGDESADAAERIHDELLKVEREAYQYWHGVERKKVRMDIADFVARNLRFKRAVEARKERELIETLAKLENALEELMQVDGMIPEKEYLLGEAIRTSSMLKGKITPEMVERAREYPISELIEIDKRGFALCLNHDDSRASMYCKNNFAHCFACGYTADSIDIYKKTHDCGFQVAVRALNKII